MTSTPAFEYVAPVEGHFKGDVEPDAAPELFRDQQKSYKYGYWRKPDGEIITAANWPTEYMQHVDKGWVPLKRYGEFLMQTAGWNPIREPYRQIFERGGAQEFSQRQIVEHNWHQRAPYKGVRFPQLNRDNIGEVTCKFCRKSFSVYNDDPAEARALAEANLARHESVSHRENSQNAGLARALKEGIIDPQKADATTSGDLQALVKQLAESQALILQLLAQREVSTQAPAVKR